MYNPRDFIFDPKKKAIRHVDDDLEILKFKDDEIQRLSNGKIELESSDAFERMFWEMDVESLKRLKEDYKRILKGNKKYYSPWSTVLIR